MTERSREEFLELGRRYARVPLVRNLLADLETPLSAYWKVAHEEPFSFLLESVTGGEHVGRYSAIGVRPRSVLFTRGRTVRRLSSEGEVRFELPPDRDPLHALGEELALGSVAPADSIPRFCGGAVGVFGHDLVRFFERLPERAVDDLRAPELAVMICDTMVVFDHVRNVLSLLSLAEGTVEGFESAQREFDRLEAVIRGPLPPLPAGRFAHQPAVPNSSPEEFQDAVRRARDYVEAGDGIQFVLSRRVSRPTQAHPLTLYRALRSINPSPFMFLLRFSEFDLIGASPELMVGLEKGIARVRPIAGTRPRGADPREDQSLAEDLLSDEKERAEHLMLVDLGRNDLGRVCEFGSVTVEQFMIVERFSHVMHLVSDVTGRLRADRDVFDLIRATFPAGTLTGAPKVRAMEIIEELEPTRRGPYGGAVGFVSAYGEADLAVNIRSIYLQNGIAHVQAGAGVVYDSVPEKEYQESLNKAAAALKAIDLAEDGLGS